MGDAGEGLIDAESRIAERMEELERERAERRAGPPPDPAANRALESLRLARADLERQLTTTTHAARRTVLAKALADLDARLREADAGS
jgi:hypothetical protein